jgi:hemoglobin-like flavoprotein
MANLPSDKLGTNSLPELRNELAAWTAQYDTMVAVKRHLANLAANHLSHEQFYKEHYQGINDILLDIAEAIEDVRTELAEYGN